MTEPLPGYAACPKCGQSAEPRWHKAVYDAYKVRWNCQRAIGTDAVSTVPFEHLHYFCACGYDWTARIKRKKAAAKAVEAPTAADVPSSPAAPGSA